jgi:hypothetical protein
MVAFLAIETLVPKEANGSFLIVFSERNDDCSINLLSSLLFPITISPILFKFLKLFQFSLISLPQ